MNPKTGASPRNHPFLTASVIALTVPANAWAFELLGAPAKEETAAFDQVWNLATLYKNEANPILQEFKLRGRYQGQNHWTDASQGDDEGWEDRRSRFGFDAKLFEKKLEVRYDFQSNDDFNDVYDRTVDAYLRYKPDKDLGITLGRTKPLIGRYDFLQSTNSQPTFERSQIFNQLRVDRATGLTVEGKTGEITWQAGGYSNDTDREFGSFDGAFSYGAGVGYDAREDFGFERADFRLDWLHSDHDSGDDQVLNRYDEIVSATFWAQNDDWGFVAEGFGAFGGNGTDGDVAGFFLQPMYDLIPKRLQLVGRYSFAIGDGADSVRAQNRYEGAAGGGQGDEYHAFYLGTQYFLHGDKLKILAGVEYATLDGGGNGGGYDGTTYLTGVRFSF
ncbi:MAG: porin [Verrucomicrobiota bacterium]